MRIVVASLPTVTNGRRSHVCPAWPRSHAGSPKHVDGVLWLPAPERYEGVGGRSMADTHAKDIGIPAGAIPSQDWRGRVWLGSAYAHETNKVITTGREVFQTVMSLLCEAEEEWMTVRPPSWIDGRPVSDPVPLWPIPDTDKVRTRAVYDSSYSTGPMERSLVRMHRRSRRGGAGWPRYRRQDAHRRRNCVPGRSA